MAWRLWAKVCCGQKWLLLLSPLFLLFITISVMLMTLPLPSPCADIDWRSSRALSSAGEFRSRPRVMEPPPVAAFQQPITHTHSGVSARKETSKHSVPPKPGHDKNSIKKRSHADLHRNKHKNKRKEKAGAIQDPTSHHQHHLRQFTVNNTQPKLRIKPSNHRPQTYIHLERGKSTAANVPTPTHTLINVRRAADRQADRWEDRHINSNAETQIHGSQTSAKQAEHHQALENHRQATKHSGNSDKVNKEQQAVKKTSRDEKKHHNLSEDPSEVKKSRGSLDRRKAFVKSDAAVKKDGSWCRSFRDRDFPDSDNRRIRISSDLWPVPWLSEDDIQKMELLAGGEVVSKTRVPAHGQVLRVALDPPAQQQQPPVNTGTPEHGPDHIHPETHSERCQQGHCCLIKRTDDWFEVFAFHLDRVLGLNRSLPVVLRTFHSDILPNRYISGTPRPVVWWDPGIQHLADRDNDQNSVPLSWAQYQKMLQVHCGSEADLRSAPCVGVHHSEWGRLALFDFLLQVNDRLDRYCCGFTPDPTELCVENLLHAKCANTKDLMLVHIL
ncbi:uncharacterized protein gask1a isoform X2 [Centropristis striata]|nr:uncharacterized protein gask1a isoform X2 [Centropristis striata]